jgi:hypothetical protein
VIDRDQLQDYRDMLATVHDRLRAHIDSGLDLDAIQAETPTADFDAFWGGGFIGADRFVEMNVRGMTAQ